MKQFDDIFSRKAKEAFESYNADHLAGEGWNSYLNKYGQNRRRAFIVPLWAKAASILVLLSIGVLFTNRSDQRNAGEQGNQLTQATQGEMTHSAINKEDTAAITPVIANPDPVSVSTVSTAGQDRHPGMDKTGNKVSESAGPALAEAVKPDELLITEAVQSDGLLITEAVQSDGLLITEAVAVEVLPEAETGKAEWISAGMNLPENPMEIRLTDDGDAVLRLNPKKTLQVFDDIPRERMTTTIMTGFSGMMASIENSKSNAQGVSIGFYVEQQLTRRISVRPGLAMAKHTYGMESTQGGSAAFDYAAPELNGLSGTTTSYEADIEVLSMEVPVNFVFSLRKRGGSNLFVTTGASTVFYLNQRLSGNFNNTYTKATVDAYGGISYESMTTSVKVESDQELLNRVDLMGLANFSAGYSMPFGKVTHISFEPFVQLPLRDLTSLNLRIRYGGLSMKIRF